MSPRTAALALAGLVALPLIARAEAPPTKAWDKTYDSGGSDDVAERTLDRAGNMVLAVEATDSAGTTVARRVEFGADGTLKGDVALDLADFGVSSPNLTVDRNRRVFAYDTVDGTRTSCQGFWKDGGLWINQYGPDGRVTVRYRHQPPNERFNWAYQVVSDKLGNVFAFGFAYQERSAAPCSVSYPYLVIKFGPSGAEQWTRTATAGSIMIPDERGGLFLVATSRTCSGCPSGCPADISILKLDANGAPAAFGTGGTKTDDWGGDDSVNSTGLDDAGRLFVVGENRTIKASTCSTTEARRKRLARYDGSTGARDVFLDLGDPSPYGGVFVSPDGQGGAGVVRVTHTTTGGSSGDTAYQVTRYTAGGAAVWTVNVPVSDSGTVFVYASTADPAGNVYVFVNTYACAGYGTSTESCMGSYRFLKYAAADGAAAWSLQSDGAAMQFGYTVYLDEGLTIRVLALSRPSGTCLDCDARDDIRVIKYVQEGSIQVTPAPEDPDNPEPQLTAASPQGALNPDKAEEVVVRVHPTTTDLAQVKAAVYSANGRLVRSDPPVLPSGATVLIGWNGKDDSGEPAAAGLYLLRVTAPGVSKIVKIVVVR